MAASREELEDLLIKSDEAGDEEAVTFLLKELDGLSAAPSQGRPGALPTQREQATAQEMQGSEEWTVTPEGSGVSYRDPAPGFATNMGRAAVKGVSETLGFPGELGVGLAKAGAWAGGADVNSIDWASPSDAFKDIFESIGLRSDLQPGSTAERFATNSVEAVSGGLTGIGAASRVKGFLSPTTKRMMEGRLGKFAGEDIAASIGGATLKTIGQESGQSEGGQTAFELAGNILTGMSVDKVTRIAEGYKTAQRLKAKGMENYAAKDARAFNAASEVLQSGIRNAGEQVDDVVRNLEGAKGDELRMTTGPMSRSVAVQSMERALINVKDNPALADEYQRFGGEFDEFVKESVRASLGGPQIPDDYVEAYMNSSKYVSDLSERYIQQATIDIQQTLADLPPVKGHNYNVEVRQKLESVYQTINDVTKEAWKAVPDAKVKVKDSPLVVALDEIYGRAPETDARIPAFAGKNTDAAGNPLPEPTVLKEGVTGQYESDPAKLPDAWVRQTVESWRDQTSVPGMAVQSFRSSVMEDARKAAAAGDLKKAGRLNTLADAALEVLDSAKSDFPAELERARNLTKELRGRMNNDVIGPLLGKSKTGNLKTPDNETMELLFQKGESGRTNMIALKAAFGGELPEEANSYVLQQAMEAGGMLDGTINPGQLQTFKTKFGETLEEMGLTETVDRYITAGKQFSESNKFWADITSEAGQTRAAKTVGMAGATGEDLIEKVATIFKHEDSSEKIMELFQKVNQPRVSVALTEKAKGGLKSAIAEGALRVIYTPKGDDISANAPMLVSRIVRAMDASGEYTAGEVERFKSIADVARRQADSKRVKVFKGQSNTPQDVARADFMGKAVRLASLKWVAPLVNAKGPGSLATASAIGQAAQKVGETLSAFFGVSATPAEVNHVLNQAVFNKALYVALLKNENTITTAEKLTVGRAFKAAGRFAVRTVVGGAARPSQAQIIGNTEEDNGN